MGDFKRDEASGDVRRIKNGTDPWICICARSLLQLNSRDPVCISRILTSTEANPQFPLRYISRVTYGGNGRLATDSPVSSGLDIPTGG